MGIEPSVNDLSRTIEILNEALSIEYSFIFQFPRIASKITDKDIKNRIQALSIDSYNHGQTVATAIDLLGGAPRWSFESFPEGISVIEFWQKQLQKEKTVLQLHKQSASLFANEHPLHHELELIANQEEYHIKTVEYILLKLK